jgi:hypothetical protein
VEEQMGVMGELVVLERYMIPAFSLTQAVESWLGPLGAPQDFVTGAVGIESKAKGVADPNKIRVNSEYQLDDSKLDHLFVHLSVFEPQSQGDADGFTVSDVAGRVRRLLEPDGRLVDRYDSLLSAAGFRFEDDYSASKWRGGERSIYLLTDGFPRLAANGLPGAITTVRYNIDLNQCGNFLVPSNRLIEALGGGHANRA